MESKPEPARLAAAAAAGDESAFAELGLLDYLRPAAVPGPRVACGARLTGSGGQGRPTGLADVSWPWSQIVPGPAAARPAGRCRCAGSRPCTRPVPPAPDASLTPTHPARLKFRRPVLAEDLLHRLRSGTP